MYSHLSFSDEELRRPGMPPRTVSANFRATGASTTTELGENNPSSRDPDSTAREREREREEEHFTLGDE